ncbi:hypothetical protein GCM10023188_05550 [Pontibacter saemangeumensis]|uniref:Antitoxin component YwqK of the YwqJK toxin-antitoxin module n=1 Tax=Pontibacter saemangeumensis TaxID=1084525 RepID=A0ABP8L9Z3_9BACT
MNYNIMSKIKLITIFLLAICYTGRSQDTTYFDVDWNITHGGEYSFYRVTSPYKTMFNVTDYYASGKVKMKGYSLSKDSLTEQGIFTYYFANGLIENKITYKDDQKHGPYSLYYTSGALKETGTHKEDKISGKNVQYFENGNIKRKAKLNNGKYNGKMVYYNENGVMIGKGRCKDDVWDGKWTKYDNNGEKVTGIHYGTSFKLKECRININPTTYVWSLFDKEEYVGYDSYLIRCVSSITNKKNPIIKAPEIRLLSIKNKELFNDFYKNEALKKSYNIEFSDKALSLKESFVL